MCNFFLYLSLSLTHNHSIDDSMFCFSFCSLWNIENSIQIVHTDETKQISCNLGPQAPNLTNATRIGNRVGLQHKPKPKPKPREICPRFQPSTQTHTSSYRSRNTTPRLGTDKTNLTPTKKPAFTSVHSKATNKSQTPKSATTSIKSVDSARNRAQTAKPNPKPTAV